MAERLTPRTPDLETPRVVSLDKELYSILSLFIQVYKWVAVTYCLGVTLRWTSIPSRLHATKIGISSGRLGLWLVCSFTITTDCHTVVYLNIETAFLFLVDLH